MSDSGKGQAVDLSNIPEPMRSLLLRQLAKMPAPLRDRLLREGSPILDRLVAKARVEVHGGVAPLPPSAAGSKHGRDVSGARATRAGVSVSRLLDAKPLPTVSPGDSVNQIAWLAAIGFALILAVAYAIYG